MKNLSSPTISQELITSAGLEKSLHSLIDGVDETKNFHWSRAPGNYLSPTTGEQNPFLFFEGTVRDWYNSFLEVILKKINKFESSTRKLIVASQEIFTILCHTNFYSAKISSNYLSPMIGFQGFLFGNIPIFVDLLFIKNNKLLVISTKDFSPLSQPANCLNKMLANPTLIEDSSYIFIHDMNVL